MHGDFSQKTCGLQLSHNICAFLTLLIVPRGCHWRRDATRPYVYIVLRSRPLIDNCYSHCARYHRPLQFSISWGPSVLLVICSAIVSFVLPMEGKLYQDQLTERKSPAESRKNWGSSSSFKSRIEWSGLGWLVSEIWISMIRIFTLIGSFTVGSEVKF